MVAISEERASVNSGLESPVRPFQSDSSATTKPNEVKADAPDKSHLKRLNAALESLSIRSTKKRMVGYSLKDLVHVSRLLVPEMCVKFPPPPLSKIG